MLNKELRSSCSQIKHVELQQHRKSICKTMSRRWFLVRDGTGASRFVASLPSRAFFCSNIQFGCNLLQQA